MLNKELALIFIITIEVDFWQGEGSVEPDGGRLVFFLFLVETLDENETENCMYVMVAKF